MTTVAVVAAVVLYLGFTLPPATIRLGNAPATTIYGAYHVHTNRSDGSGTMADVAAAAAEAALQFVIVTDHGDATRPPEPPQYLHGVLLIDAVEISTISGHLVAIGLNAAAPFPFGGEARDTVADVHRMGGWTVAAHPDSPHDGLRWRGGDLLVDGIEWLNADSEWRDEPPARLMRTLGHYVFRPSESIASLFDRPSASLRRWDELSRRRRVVGLAGVDAHARIGTDDDAEVKPSRTILARPSYKEMFRTVAQGVLLSEPLTGDASRDATAILRALRTGRTYSVVRAIASPGEITFSATDGSRMAGMGESLEGSGPAAAPGAMADKPVTVSASVPAPANASVVLLRDGEEVAAGTGSASYKTTGDPAAYRAEVRLPNATVPWIVTNVIRIGPVATETREVPVVPVVIRRLDDQAPWAAEKHPTSQSDVRADGGEVAMTFRLAAGRRNSQYAAMSYPLGGKEAFESVTATLRASAPMRVSVQVRQPGGPDGERWQRSVYVDETPREVTLRLQDFQREDGVTDRKPTPALISSVLFVVDTWHTKPGASGTVWVSRVSIGGPVPSFRSAR